MHTTKVELNYKADFTGTLTTDSGEFLVGRGEDRLLPYPMLLGALGSCYYSVFLDIMEKMQLPLEGVSMTITGVNRDESPTTLQTVDIDFTIRGGAEDEKSRANYEKACKLAGKYCSIHVTISKVAEIKTNVHFA